MAWFEIVEKKISLFPFFEIVLLMTILLYLFKSKGYILKKINSRIFLLIFLSTCATMSLMLKPTVILKNNIFVFKIANLTYYWGYKNREHTINQAMKRAQFNSASLTVQITSKNIINNYFL